jgi:hypothetical protein
MEEYDEFLFEAQRRDYQVLVVDVPQFLRCFCKLFSIGLLNRCCVLVDATRGLCGDDLRLLKFIRKVSFQFHFVVFLNSFLLGEQEMGDNINQIRSVKV